MALSEWEYMPNDDPWKVSALLSAGVELFLSILLLLCTAIAFFASRFAKFFGLEPQCTYMGCFHPFYSESLKGQMLHTPPSCKSKDLCRGDFYFDCHPLRIHSKSHLSRASIQKEGSDAFDSSDYNAKDHDLDGPYEGYGDCHARRCFCSESPWNVRRGVKHTTYIHTASTSKLKNKGISLPLSRSDSGSSGGLDGKDHSEISEVPTDLEDKWAWKGTHVKKEENIDTYLISVHDGEAPRRSGVPEDFDERLHGMSPSLMENCQEESAETLQLYAIEEPRVSQNDCEHCKQQEVEAVVDETAISTAPAKCGESSEYAGGPAFSEDKEEEIMTEEKQEEGWDSLKVALQDERSVLAALEAELENERNAAAIATSQAMAMITRLQEEKSALQIKVAQLQRMSEEKAEYDEQAMGLLKEILYKRETENFALEKEVELYRETLSDELNKRSLLHEEIESSIHQSLKPLLLTDGEDVLSPIEDRKHKQGSAITERGFQSGIRSAPSLRQHGPHTDLEELNGFSLDQNVNKRLRDSPMSLKAWDEEGKPGYHVEGDRFFNSEQLKKTGSSIFSGNDEESVSYVLERLWVLEEGLQTLHGKDSTGGQPKAHGAQRSAVSSIFKSEDKSLTDVWGGQNGCGIESKERKEEVAMDGGGEGYVPIHDVYEVQIFHNRSPPFAERDPPQAFEGVSGKSEVPPGGTLESHSGARMAKHRIPISPRFSPAKKLFLSDEVPSTPVSAPSAAGSIVGKSLHLEDAGDPQDLQVQSVGLREEKGTTNEGIEQLAVRLKTLEEDRELWRESLESFTHRDAELNLLQEIARHLRELRMAGFMNKLGDALPEDIVTATSPSKNRPVKKRRYCVGSAQARMPFLYQNSLSKEF